MVAGGQDRRDFLPLPALRPGEMRMLQKAGLEALLGNRLGVTGNAWKQSNTGLDQRLGGHLAARQHEIPEGDLFELPTLDDALVQPFKAPAKYNYAWTCRKLADVCLGQRLSPGRKVNPGAAG